MAVFKVGKSGDSPDPEQFRKLFGPGHVAQMVSQAIHTCWMTLPEKRKNVDDLEKEFRRLVERAFRNIREDEATLGS